MMTPSLMMLDSIGKGLSHPAMQQLGWVLVHFVWQGAVVAGLLAGALALVHRKNAQLRYAISLAALAILLVLPVTTWILWPAGGGEGTSATDVQAALQYLDARGGTEIESEPVTTSWTTALQSTIAVGLRWIVAGWLMGVLLLGGRQLGGWGYTIYLRRWHVRPVGSVWQQRIEALSARLGVRGRVRVRQSAIIDVPMVIGWLRPVVLVPVGVLTGLPPQQVDALIAHELSHIRRHDVLVGWVQGVAETLLFYHPAVWWISWQIRVEREHCCDDLAVAACRDQLTYARALTTLATQRSAAPVGALAANDGSLLTRIRRLVEPASRTSKIDRMKALLALAVTTTVLVIVGACASQRPEATAAAAEPPGESLAGSAAAGIAGPSADTSEADGVQPKDATAGVSRRSAVHIAPTPDESSDIRVYRALDDSNDVVTVWTRSDHDRMWSRLDSFDDLDSLIGRDVRIHVERALAMADTLPDPLMPDRPPLFLRDSLGAIFPGIDVPDIDFDFRALDSLRFPQVPMPPPAIYLDGDTITFEALRSPLADSLHAVLPRLGAFPDSLERARIDSIRQRIEREMRAHQEEMRRFSTAHRERMEGLQRELRERMMEEQPQRLRDQAEALRRQAERLEEQAREMEQQRAPDADTTGTSGWRGTLPFDAAPWAALRGGSRAVLGPPAQNAWADRHVVTWRFARAAAEAEPIWVTASTSAQGRVPNLAGWLQRVERTSERSVLR